MKVRDFIKFLLDFDMDTQILVSTGDTYDDLKDFTLTWGGIEMGDGDPKINAEFVNIELNDNAEVKI